MLDRDKLYKFVSDDTCVLTKDKLALILKNDLTVQRFYHHLYLLDDYKINKNINRLAMFLAQTMHESNNWTVFVENLNYSEDGLLKTFSRYFDKDNASLYARNPEKIANRVYASRMGNGDELSGDGWKYRGKGLIQLTGKAQHIQFAKDVKMDLAEACGYLITPKGALHSACWWWLSNAKRINQYADIGDVKNSTVAINGGLNGIEDRNRKYYDCLRLLEI